MIGLDTNVLVRYLAQDDAKQSALATRLIEKELTRIRQGFISLVVVAELCRVLGMTARKCESQIRTSKRLVNIVCQKTNLNSGITLPDVPLFCCAVIKSFVGLKPIDGLGKLVIKVIDHGQLVPYITASASETAFLTTTLHRCKGASMAADT